MQEKIKSRYLVHLRNIPLSTHITFSIFLVLIGLRLYGLGNQSLWLDEAISVTVAKQSLAQIIQYAKADVHPPLYYILLHLWMCLGHDESTIRALSALLSIGSGLLLYTISLQVYGRFVGVLSLFLFAISPFQIQYAQEARMYTMLGFFALGSTYALLKFVQGQRIYWLAANVILSTLAVYTHYQAFLVILAQSIWMVAFNHHKRRLLRSWLSGQLGVIIAFFPWWSSFMRQFFRGGRAWIPFTPRVSLLTETLMSFGIGDFPRRLDIYQGLGIGALVVLLCAIIISLTYADSKRRSGTILFVLLLVVPLLSSFILSFSTNVYGTKYLIAASFPYYILLASRANACRKWSVLWMGILAAVIILPGLFSLYGYHTHPVFQREDWRGAVEHVRQHSLKGDVIAFYWDKPMAPFEYYNTSAMTAVGLLHGQASLEEVRKAIAELKGRYQRVWLFNYLAWLYDPRGLVVANLRDQGFIPAHGRDFNGVPIALWTSRQLTEERLVESFETGLEATQVWDHHLNHSALLINADPRFVSDGQRSLKKEVATNEIQAFHYGGVEMGLAQLPFLFDLWLVDSDNAKGIYIYVYDEGRDFVARWHRDLLYAPLEPGRKYTFLFACGVSLDEFEFLGGSCGTPRYLDTIVEVGKSKDKATFFVDNVRVIDLRGSLGATNWGNPPDPGI